MHKIFISLLLLLTTLSIYAADIKGIVLEPDKSTAEYVTVVLKLPGETQNITGTTTDLDGRFLLSNVKKGSYVLEVSMIGYKTVTKNITVANDDSEVNLKNIILEEDSKLLDQVEVVAQASQMHFDIDKKVFDVDQNLASAGASASEVLEHIPSVSVDQDGEVSLRNSTNVEVWINGKPSGLDSDNRAQILQQMPAGSIEKVEIITNPSAKYSPEGTAGIINLVLKKDRKVGYYGSLEAGLGYQWKGMLEPRFSGNFNFNSSLVDFYINAGLRTHNMKGSGTTDRWTFTPGTNRTDTLTFLGQDNIGKHGNNGVFVRTGVDFHLG
jgi:Outer membrane cobalamin receptor protein